MERLNYGTSDYGRWDYGDHEEDYSHDDDHDLDLEAGHDHDFGVEDHVEGLWEQAEHQADYAADDSLEAGSDFGARVGWRSKAHRRQMGRFVPPDRRGYAAPVFVRVADLLAGAPSGSDEEGGPEA